MIEILMQQNCGGPINDSILKLGESQDVSVSSSGFHQFDELQIMPNKKS